MDSCIACRRYPWVFLDDSEYDEEFRNITTAAAGGGPVRYGHIGPEHWGYPSWVPEQKAAEARRQQAISSIMSCKLLRESAV